MNMLANLFTSQTRVKILMRLFFNKDLKAYIQELARDFDISSSQITYELNQLSKAGLVKSEKNGRYMYYSADDGHPLFPELRSMVMKSNGATWIIDKLLTKLGKLDMAILIGDYAEGKDAGIIDLILVGEIDEVTLIDLRKKVEKHVKRKIRTLTLTPEEYEEMGLIKKGVSHLVIWDRTRDKKRAGEAE